MIDLTDVSEEELLEKTGLTLKEYQELQAWMNEKQSWRNIRWLQNGIAFYPVGYDSEAALVDGLERRGEKDRHMISARLGFHIGYQEGFRQAAKYVCDALGLKHRWD